jgi:hypothetical protein
MLDERRGATRLQVQKEQLSFEKIPAVVVARADCKEREPGVESHGVHGIARTEKRSAGQIIGAVDTNRRSTTELVHARHCQQATVLVINGEDGITDLGEGTVTEDSVDAERDGHGGDLLSGQKLREATDFKKPHRRT